MVCIILPMNCERCSPESLHPRFPRHLQNPVHPAPAAGKNRWDFSDKCSVKKRKSLSQPTLSVYLKPKRSFGFPKAYEFQVQRQEVQSVSQRSGRIQFRSESESDFAPPNPNRQLLCCIKNKHFPHAESTGKNDKQKPHHFP